MVENQSRKLPVVLICFSSFDTGFGPTPEALGIVAAGYTTEGSPAIHDFDGHRSLP